MKTMTKAKARQYYGKCAECGDPATYGEVDNVKLCLTCASIHGLVEGGAK